MRKLKTQFVSNDLIYALLCMIVCLIVSHWLIQLLIISLTMLITTQRFNRISLIILIFGVIFMARIHLITYTPTFSKATIVDVTETQTIFKQHHFYASAFGTEYGQIGDELEINGTFKYHQPSPYQKSLFLKNNLGQLRIRDAHRVDQKLNLMTQLRKWSSQHHDSDILNLYLYSKTSERFDDNSLYLALVSHGIHMSSFLWLIRNIFEKLLPERKVYRLVVISIIILFFLFGMSFILCRLAIAHLLNHTQIKLSRNNKTFLEILCILFLYPIALTSPIFILTYSLKLSRFILGQDNDQPFIRTSFLAFLQLHLFYRFNILESIFFRFFSRTSALLFMMALLSWIWPINILLIQTHKLMLFLLEHLDFSIITLVGKPNIFVSILWLYIIIFFIRSRFKLALSQLVIPLQSIIYLVNGTLSVNYIDVGQGDATLIRFPYHQNITLIDTGKPSHYTQLKRELYRLGIKKVDQLIITHDDMDHSGNVEILDKEFDVGKIVDTHQSMEYFQMLLPKRIAEDTNDASLIIYLNVGNQTFLWTGDVSKAVERQLIKEHPSLTIDFLKLGHHGSKTSSDNNFLHQLNPILAIISSDPDSYGHPHPEVMRTLYDLKIQSLQTSQVGTIEIVITKWFAYVKADQHLFLLK